MSSSTVSPCVSNDKNSRYHSSVSGFNCCGGIVACSGERPVITAASFLGSIIAVFFPRQKFLLPVLYFIATRIDPVASREVFMESSSERFSIPAFRIFAHGVKRRRGKRSGFSGRFGFGFWFMFNVKFGDIRGVMTLFANDKSARFQRPQLRVHGLPCKSRAFGKCLLFWPAFVFVVAIVGQHQQHQLLACRQCLFECPRYCFNTQSSAFFTFANVSRSTSDEFKSMSVPNRFTPCKMVE